MEKLTEVAIHIFGVSAIRYFVLAGIPFALFYWVLPRKLKRFKIQPKLASNKDFVRDVWHSMQSTLVFTVISVMLLFTPVRRYTQIYDHLSDFPSWYILLSLVLSLIIHDTYFYWMHRTLHHKSLFKLTHVLHHKSTNPSPWTSYSFHVLEAIAEGLVLVVIAMVIPIHPFTILLFTIVAFVINVYGHLGYEVAPKSFRNSWLFLVLNTSVFHNLHHSKFKGNYGLYFRVWDRMMGTEHPDYVKAYDRVQEQRFGS